MNYPRGNLFATDFKQKVWHSLDPIVLQKPKNGGCECNHRQRRLTMFTHLTQCHRPSRSRGVILPATDSLLYFCFYFCSPSRASSHQGLPLRMKQPPHF